MFISYFYFVFLLTNTHVAGTRCVVLRGSLCVYVFIALIYSAAKLRVSINFFTFSKKEHSNKECSTPSLCFVFSF